MLGSASWCVTHRAPTVQSHTGVVRTEPEPRGESVSEGTPLLNLRLTAAVTSWLSELAAEHGTTRSDLVRAALRQVTPDELWHDAPEHQRYGTAAAAQALAAASERSTPGRRQGAPGGTAASAPDSGRRLSGAE